jgi:spermidine/putrescine transport system permease protein
MVEKQNVFARMIQPLWVVATYLFLYVPIVVLVLFSFNASEVSVAWEGFTLDWYRQMIQTPELIDALYVSLNVALCSTVLSSLLAVAFVYAMQWYESKIWYTVFYANILFPEIIIGIGLLSFFSYFHIPLGYGSLIAGHTLIGLGFAVPIIRGRFAEINPILTEASADLGASEFQTFYKVILPLLRPSLIASGLLVFTLSLDDFLIAFFCSSARVQTLSVYVFSLVREGVNPTINAVSTCLLAVSSMVIVILSYMNVLDQVMGHD